jgi:hypothetical protein
MVHKQSGSKNPMAGFITGGNSTVKFKIEAIKNLGGTVAESPALIGKAIVAAMNG